MSTMQRVEDWQVKAACRGPQGTAVFFPPSNFERKDEKEDRESRAKGICSGCLVSKACLEYAISIKELHGIWGGTNEVERKALLAQRGI
jgi:WhiB family transcriptional regulator, redox-sensing transcriptional regulator